MGFVRIVGLLALLVTTGLASGQSVSSETAVTFSPELKQRPRLRADLRLEESVVLAGREVWALFTLTNLSDQPVHLDTPEAEVSQDTGPQPLGLPLSHVFSGPAHTAIVISDGRGMVFGQDTAWVSQEGAPLMTLAPYGCIGLRVELTRYYDSLTRSGEYELHWRPYEGRLPSRPARLKVMAEQQAVIVTDVGDMTMRFYHDKAPHHVDNFVELVREGFYDNLTFHRVIPGGLVQGGCPRGDGYGIRPDGRRLEAEFNDVSFVRGTVGMARSPSAPDSASCQFFICLGRQPGFDGQQTAFGYLVGEKSFRTLDSIESTPTGPKDRPIKKVYIRAISLENVPERDRETVPPDGLGRLGPGHAPESSLPNEPAAGFVAGSIRYSTPHAEGLPDRIRVSATRPADEVSER